jgi:hypothetical protein
MVDLYANGQVTPGLDHWFHSCTDGPLGFFHPTIAPFQGLQGYFPNILDLWKLASPN